MLDAVKQISTPVHMRLSLLACQSVMCALLLVPPHGQKRPRAKAFKGVELYSWTDSEGAWVFALLPGTNRLKTEAEIKKKENRISGVKELEKRFFRLAEGEQVFWFHRGLKGFAYPDEGVLADLASSARKAKVELKRPP